MNDEQAWTTAGKLLLVDHLNEVKLGFGDYSDRWKAHTQLSTRYGYDMSRCRCIPPFPSEPIRVWGSKPV